MSSRAKQQCGGWLSLEQTVLSSSSSSSPQWNEQLRDAVFAGNLPTVRRILQQPPGGGFNVNAGDEGGFTALHAAVDGDHVAILQAILQVEGVNLNVRTNRGLAPLHWA